MHIFELIIYTALLFIQLSNVYSFRQSSSVVVVAVGLLCDQSGQPYISYGCAGILLQLWPKSGFSPNRAEI